MERLIVLHEYSEFECLAFKEKMDSYCDVILSSLPEFSITPSALNDYQMVFIISKARELPAHWDLEEVMKQIPVVLILSSELPDLIMFVGMFEVMERVDAAVHSSDDSQQARLFRKALMYIEENLGSNELALDVLSSYLCISPSYCSRIFQKYAGKGFKEYTMERRIQLAKSLLEGGSLVTDVCLSVGYGDLTHFTRTFRRLIGMNPSEYRVAHLRKTV
ncbi:MULTISPECIES: helix-turn-helix transcriptional regulator [unclassified Paenibacillus]|uniref:Helix-turn-helix transcriptional regulator n=1 Tax=Paenibacillus provencensis TaxID=441151 RepID=A0ABW3PSX0_9BACL|nr:MULTISPECIES: helix-turn-helix transcriptional regulator [unclassified Paenibacillus]MCM3129672.1 helix-turn-helix transcriptional regulator [Paenibacillus sp. MER 78]SFS54573.1 AraC-type DNA-binding protein [Paenibacillus sp. 453mf]